jgi:hypothetical protein
LINATHRATIAAADRSPDGLVICPVNRRN